MGVRKWVAAFPAVSCACPGGCRPPDPPLRRRGGYVLHPEPPRKAPPACTGGAFWGGPGGR
eukprot:12445510-Alexandrium_andersonii.AAC.1